MSSKKSLVNTSGTNVGEARSYENQARVISYHGYLADLAEDIVVDSYSTPLTARYSQKSGYKISFSLLPLCHSHLSISFCSEFSICKHSLTICSFFKNQFFVH